MNIATLNMNKILYCHNNCTKAYKNNGDTTREGYKNYTEQIS
jgi:hypothetical protein